MGAGFPVVLSEVDTEAENAPGAKTVHCYPAYLTYMQGTHAKMPGWMKHKVESRFLEKISITSEIQTILALLQKVKN